MPSYAWRAAIKSTIQALGIIRFKCDLISLKQF